MYPNHPNLLPAYFENPKEMLGSATFNQEFADKHWVSKPIFGREGLGVFFSQNFTNTSNFDQFVKITEENFGRDNVTNEKLGKSIYQMYTPLPEAQGRIIQTSAWVINGMPAGLAFREGKAGTFFEDMNPFLPHVVKGAQGPQLELKLSDAPASFAAPAARAASTA